MGVPAVVIPFAPAGEQNAPGWTRGTRGATVVGAGAGVAGVATKGGLSTGRGCAGQVDNTPAMAWCSAAVTHRWYFTLTATWIATYAQRNPLLGGSQVAASASPFCW